MARQKRTYTSETFHAYTVKVSKREYAVIDLDIGVITTTQARILKDEVHRYFHEAAPPKTICLLLTSENPVRPEAMKLLEGLKTIDEDRRMILICPPEVEGCHRLRSRWQNGNSGRSWSYPTLERFLMNN